MSRHSFAVSLLVAAALVAGGLVSGASAAPPRPGTDDNGLTQNESATLWSRDNDSRYITNAAYRRAYGEQRTVVQQVANRTDLTFRRPPATAGIWTRHDLADYTPGNERVSVYPTSAKLTDGTYIRDAHATIFAVTPSTVAHTTPNTTTRYIASSGTVLGAVDYRVVAGRNGTIAPNRSVRSERLSGNTSRPTNWTGRRVSWSIASHEIAAVRLRHDGRVIARTDGSHRPRLQYALDGRDGSLTLEAEITVRLRRTVTVTRRVNRSGPNGTRTVATVRRHNTSVVTESVTVSDRIEATVYTLDPSFQYTRYPNGELGVAISQHRPWQGYELRGSPPVRVQSVWRFYTARTTGWETLVRSTATGTTRNASDALPVVVHAYPSQLGSRLASSGRGAELIERWGTSRPSPANTIGEHVAVAVPEDDYVQTVGMAIRFRGRPSTPVVVHGLVHGVNRTLRPAADGQRRRLRESNLTVERVSQNASGITVRITLRAAATGEPIGLSRSESPRYDPLVVDDTDAYISVGDRRVRTNRSGMATVRIEQSGVYTVRYHPESWLTHDPAYTSAATTVRWHPLATIGGWLALGTRALQWFLPFAVVLYAGRRLGGMFRYRGEP